MYEKLLNLDHLKQILLEFKNDFFKKKHLFNTYFNYERVFKTKL